MVGISASFSGAWGFSQLLLGPSGLREAGGGRVLRRLSLCHRQGLRARFLGLSKSFHRFCSGFLHLGLHPRCPPDFSGISDCVHPPHLEVEPGVGVRAGCIQHTLTASLPSAFLSWERRAQLHPICQNPDSLQGPDFGSLRASRLFPFPRSHSTTLSLRP